MRYMMMVMGDAAFEAGETASEGLMQAMGEYIGRMAQEGVFIDGAGLRPSAKGFRAKARGGKISLTDGPFTEAKEIIGGFAIVECRDDAHARQVAREFIEVHTENGVLDIDCEIRPFEAEPEAN